MRATPNREPMAKVAQVHKLYPEESPELLFRGSASVNEALGHSIAGWEQIEPIGRWIINSHPKSGTHLLRNILLHFNHRSVNREILFFDTFTEALQRQAHAQFFNAHIPYKVAARSIGGGSVNESNTVLLLRHPCAIAVALARAFYDVNTSRLDHLYMRQHDSFAQIVQKVVCGYDCLGMQFSPLSSSLFEFSVDWLDKAGFTIRFETLLEMLEADDRVLLDYLGPMLESMFQSAPSDAAARIRAGAAPAISATYSRTNNRADGILAPAAVYSLLPADMASKLRAVAATLGY